MYRGAACEVRWSNFQLGVLGSNEPPSCNYYTYNYEVSQQQQQQQERRARNLLVLGGGGGMVYGSTGRVLMGHMDEDIVRDGPA